jgi:hypothetical protein
MIGSSTYSINTQAPAVAIQSSAASHTDTAVLRTQFCNFNAFHAVLVRSLFQSEFSAQCDLVLRLSIYSIFSFRQRHPVAAYVFFFSPLPYTFPSIRCFSRQSLRNMGPIQLAFLPFIVCRAFPSFWLRIILRHFSQDRANCCSAFPSCTTVQHLI